MFTSIGFINRDGSTILILYNDSQIKMNTNDLMNWINTLQFFNPFEVT